MGYCYLKRNRASYRSKRCSRVEIGRYAPISGVL